jgi:methylmalonyl-CoA mutase N-terminal domain/subunit
MANAIAYVEAAVAAGLEVDSFAPRLSFFFNSHADFLTEIAKFRAARRLYARIMRERFGAKDDRSCMLRFHTQTAGSSLTAQQPDVNLVRTALEAMAAVLGGTQSLHTNARDEALGLPTEESARLALRTQQIIAYETGVTNTADPVGGSFYIEELTDNMEREALGYIRRIDEMGGTLRAIEAGFIQGEIQTAAYEFQRGVESGERVIVGVNRFVMDERANPPAFRIDPAMERARVACVRELRTSRDAAGWKQALDRLENAARGTENLMPAIMDAAQAYATVGEISDTLRGVFGEYRDAQ